MLTSQVFLKNRSAIGFLIATLLAFTSASGDSQMGPSAKTLSLKTKVWTTRIEETKAFYQSVFGLVVVDEWNDPDDVGVILAFAEDRLEALLELYHSEEPRDLSGVSLQFRVENIEVFAEQIRGKVSFDGPKDRPWGSRYIYIKDPNDILIIVYEGGL